MIVFPNAKINLGLNILRKRSDGYHELETCFYPVPWFEALEIVESKETIIDTTGIEIPNSGENIVLKAYHLLKKSYDLPPVHIHLHKAIPIGAGLGGGSADAAFALTLLNSLFSINLSDGQLANYAVELGADCAFFLKNKPCLAAGIGDELSDLNISLTGKFIVLIYPNIHISTNEAYSGIVPKNPAVRISDILVNYMLEEWKEVLVNDFELHLFHKYTELKSLKLQLYDMGAVYASMSGSGSTVYGIFHENPAIAFSDDFKVWSGRL